MALGKSRTVSEPHSSPSQTYDSIYERAVKEQMWRSGLRSCLGVISHDPGSAPYGGYHEHLRFTEEETEALRGGLESPGHTKSRQHANSVWVPGQNPEPSPVYSPLPTPSCVQMGCHCLDLTVASVAPVFVFCLSHYKDRSTGQGLCFAHCHVSATTTGPGPEQVPHDHLLSELVKKMKAFPSEEPKKVAWGSWR